MKTIYTNLKSFINKQEGLNLIKCPWANRYWHNATASGFSDTYKIVGGIRHRRKFYIKYVNDTDLNILLNYLNKSNISYNYKDLTEYNYFHYIRLTLYWDTN